MKQVYPILEPTDEEKNKKSWKSVESEGTPFKLKYMECRGMPKKSKKEVVSKKPVKSQKTAADCNPRSSNELVNPRVEETSRQAGPEDPTSKAGPEDPTYSFTYSQRQAFVEEIGEYVVQKLMGQQFAQQIGDYTVRQVMSQLPQYMDFMRHIASINNPEVQMGDKSNAREVRENVGVSAGHGPDALVQSGNEKVAGDNEDQNSTPTGNAWISPCPMPSQLSSRWGTQYESYPYFAPTQFTQGDASQSSIPSKLDYKEVRRREPSAILRSPFRIDDKRGNDFAKYLRTGGKRNVGLQNDVDSSFFKCIKNKSTLLEDIHIDAYLVVLHAQPGLAKLNKVDERVTITSTGFMAAITQAWKKYHKTDCNEQLNPDVEEVIPVEDLYELSKYVTGDLPGWGKYKPWYDYDELIMVCELQSHWVTCSVNFIKSAITIYDSTQHKLDDTDYAVRKTFFTPLARMLPQILKYSGFYDERKEVKPKLTEWHFAYPESGNVYKQTDIKSGGAYALKYAEMILTKQHLPSFEKKDVEKFRVDVAATIYKFSTEG